MCCLLPLAHKGRRPSPPRLNPPSEPLPLPPPPPPPPPRRRAKCTKNKVAPPYRLAEFDIMFGSGISAAGCLLDAAEAVEVVSRRGSWYYHGEARLAQGRDKTLEVLREDDALRRCGRGGGGVICGCVLWVCFVFCVVFCVGWGV